MEQKSSYLIVDIETIPDNTLWKAPVPTSLFPGSTSHGEPLKKPFPPTYAHRVITVGCLWLDSNYRFKKIGILGNGSDESSMLMSFSNFVEKHKPALVTYNGRRFDLPVMALRSLHCGVTMGWYYKDQSTRHRYSEEGHIDLCDWLTDHGAAKQNSLDAMARLIGLPGKIGINGSQVEGLFKEGHIEKIQQYCLADVAQTALLFLRFRLLQGVLSRADYQQAVSSLRLELSNETCLSTLCAAIDDQRLLSAA